LSPTTAILQILFNAQPSRLMETVLLAELRMMCGGCGESEFRTARQQLIAGGYINAAKDDLTGDVFFKIEPRGIARIRGN
jgi:hypothetical protein